MKLIPQSPKKALKAFLKQRPTENERDTFKANLISLLDKIAVVEKLPRDESEEHLKNNLRDFLRDTYYLSTNAINTKDKKDLVIHTGKTTDTDAAVLIEAKRPSNAKEMVTADNPNRKALHELILYYLDERIGRNNTQLKQLVATDIHQWFIIDANQFDKHVYRNIQIKKLYETKVNDKKDNPWFYEEVAKAVASIDNDIPCVYFDIRNYEKILRNATSEDDKELVALYKILSPQHLLKLATPNDSNALNKKFYDELLHIIGLEEAKEGSKNIIRRKKENRNAASLIESAIEAIETKGTHRVADLQSFGENKDKQNYNIALELCITWINRVLFLKLLEGQLVSYHQGDRGYRFLNSETVHDFDELYKLFHKVLAVNIPERNMAIKAKYNRVPYLNSSLFEVSELEDQTIQIDSLDDDGELDLLSATVLKDVKRKTPKLPTLDYLFQFLDAYDFASEGTEDWQRDNKQLINASVLGKVFEKINGYRDGSIFTPAFITMYMCRQSIRLAVVQKFNEAIGGDKAAFDKFEDVKNYTAALFKTDDVLKANDVINSLRICDPAVGSGHFLVSALNEIIAIKAELGILADEKGNKLSQYEIEVVNDELDIRDQNADPVQYKLVNGKPATKEMQRLQRTLFREKQTIIENCLFGVDINPKSVLICRLRLWIELLKNAYYKEPETPLSRGDGGVLELETLPNIDINIKCGNSLLSRFPLDADLSKALKSIKYNIKAYRGFVNDYKNEKNREVKRGLQKIIDSIKSDFATQIGMEDKRVKKLNKLGEELYLLTTKNRLSLEFDVVKGAAKKEALKKKQLEDEISALKTELDDVKNNAVYKNAFEWRFEFPEVLNNNGEYDGFDVLIGNPPYIESRSSVVEDKVKDEILRSIKQRRGNDAQLIARGSDILIYFFELGLNLIKSDGYFSFITQNSWLDTEYGFKFQKFLRSNTDVLCVLDDNTKYFGDSANINTIITLFKGRSASAENKINFVRLEKGFDTAPFDPAEFANTKTGKTVSLSQGDEIVSAVKWGVLSSADDTVIEIHSSLLKHKREIDFELRIGQGLNLSKEYVLTEQTIDNIGLEQKNVFPFFTADDGAPFLVSSTSNFILNDSTLSSSQISKLKANGYKIPEINSDSRKTPNLILPRGLGRYFCAVNNCKCYSASFVEIYLDKTEKQELYSKFIWLFLNSSLGWFIREISGRKNLGGGMLKAEAVDLKAYPILFDFSGELQKINRIFSEISKRQAANALVELYTEEHKAIDEIVFEKFGYNSRLQEQIIFKVFELIHVRTIKSKSNHDIVRIH